ncbi:hypothetical protein SAMN04488601_1161 [Paenibacillus sp. 453mf]|nr:hypothetical protein SAMN04488601_1161 [Paenibacillus sp. 453mf]
MSDASGRYRTGADLLRIRGSSLVPVARASARGAPGVCLALDTSESRQKDERGHPGRERR